MIELRLAPIVDQAAATFGVITINEHHMEPLKAGTPRRFEHRVRPLLPINDKQGRRSMRRIRSQLDPLGPATR